MFPFALKAFIRRADRLLAADERQGSAMPEQVTMKQNRPVDRGLSCIPLFVGLEWGVKRPVLNFT